MTEFAMDLPMHLDLRQQTAMLIVQSMIILQKCEIKNKSKRNVVKRFANGILL